MGSTRVNGVSRAKAAQIIIAVADVASWIVATALVASIQLLEGGRGELPIYVVFAALAGALQLLIGYEVKLYRGRAKLGSFLEASTAVLVVTAVAVALLLATVLARPRFIGVALVTPFVAFVLMLGVRYLVRESRRRRLLHLDRVKAEPVLIYGAGNAGTQLTQQLFYDDRAPFVVVGLIDDDPALRNLHLANTRVVGTRDDLVRQAHRLGATKVILAITDASSSFIQLLDEELKSADLELLVLPPLRDIVGGQVRVADLHEVDFNDLLGRRPIETDLSAIAESLSGKVVLITGAGGSIGSEIARQVHAFGPKELVCLDRDESALHGVQLSIYGKGLLDTPDMVLCDIRDLEALDAVFAAHRPQVVFHAAALKHLPMLEQYPDEGWKTNVVGSYNVLTCAAKYGVDQYVNISTDKAADPSSVLGKTKRNAERLTAWFAENEPGTYVSVRFGNVLGSRGSVLHTFHAQIKSGGPVTVVDPQISRFFMTIPEAVQLVLQAATIGQSGDVMVFDMGEPVKILDVAQRLIKASAARVEIQFTGLRPGEKLHEVLFSDLEAPTRMSHPLISRVHVEAASRDEVETDHQSIFENLREKVS